jgi:hypothetical protein
MNQYDLAGIMQSYAYLFKNARNREHLMDIVDRLKSELDKRKIRFVGKDGEQDE